MDPVYVRLMDRLYLASIWLAGSAITLMSLVVPWGVFTRYVLGTGSRWPEPIAILLMMVFTFIGGAAAYRANAHIAVTMLTDAMPHALQRLAALLVDLLMMVVSLFVAWYGTRLCVETMRQSIAELPWLPVGVTYLSLPLGSAITLLFVIERRLFGAQDQRLPVRQEEHTDLSAEGRS
jgi:TRAP-type C4-dicarboxylate transport system permease small subunit